MFLVDLLPDEDLGDLDIRIARYAEDRDQLALGILVGELRKLSDRNHRGVAVFALAQAAGHDDRTAYPRVVRLEPGAPSATAQDAGHARVATLDDVFDSSLDPARGSADHRDAHAVAVKGGSDAVRRDVHVFLAGRGDETETPRMDAQRPLPGVAAVGCGAVRSKAMAGEPPNRPIEAQLLEQLEQSRIGALGNGQTCADFARVERLSRVG